MALTWHEQHVRLICTQNHAVPPFYLLFPFVPSLTFSSLSFSVLHFSSYCFRLSFFTESTGNRIPRPLTYFSICFCIIFPQIFVFLRFLLIYCTFLFFHLLFLQLSFVLFKAYLDAPSHLYKRSCPSVGPSVRPSVRRSVGPSVRRSVRPSVRPVLFSKVKSTHTRRILCRVSDLVLH